MRILLLLAASCLAGDQPQCPRGEGEPWLPAQRSEVRTQSFERTSATGSVERVELRGGDVVEIEHAGCEYYTVIIRLLPRTAAAGDLPAYARGAGVLETLSSLGAASVFDLKLAAQALRAVQPQPGDQLPVEGDGTEFLQTVVTVVGAEAPASIEIHLSKGPL